MGRPRISKLRKQLRENERWFELEEFLRDEMERYVKLHKEHGKEIKYIG